MLFIALAATLVAGSLSAEEKAALLLHCPAGTSEAACNPSRHDLKEAKSAFAHGLKVQRDAPEQAYREFERAAQLVPRDIEYVTARELSRQQLVSRYLQRGNAELESGKQVEAFADFRGALQLDPANEFAQQRLRRRLSRQTASGVSIVDESAVQLAPNSIDSLATIAPSSRAPSGFRNWSRSNQQSLSISTMSASLRPCSRRSKSKHDSRQIFIAPTA